MTWTIRLPYTRPPLSLNGREHWAVKARLTRQLRNEVTIRALFHRIPRLEKAHVELHWVPRDSRKRDTDNPYPTLKAAIDGLRDAQIVADDDSKRVTSAVVIDEPQPKNAHLYLLIEENP